MSGAHYSPDPIIQRVRDAGATVIYLNLHQGRNNATLPEDRFIWIDPQWDWQEASTRIEGYDVPVGANSGIVNTIIFEEILNR